MPWINTTVAPASLILQGPLTKKVPTDSGGHTWDYEGNAVVRFDSGGQSTLAGVEVWSEGDMPPGVYARTGAAQSALGRFYFEVARIRPPATKEELKEVVVAVTAAPTKLDALRTSMEQNFVLAPDTFNSALGDAVDGGIISLQGDTVQTS